MRMNTVVSVALVLSAAACASGPTRGQYDDPVLAAQAESVWATRLTEADLERLARAAREKIEACVASEAKAPEVRVLAVEDRTGKNADTVTLTERMKSGLLRRGKVRAGDAKARFILASALSWDAASSGYRLTLSLSEGGSGKNRCEESVVLAKSVLGAAE